MTTPDAPRTHEPTPGMTGHGAALCGAQRRQRDGTCQHEAGWGTDHPGIGACKFHGGSTPNHRTAAALVATDAEARATLARLGEPEPLGDPVEELLRLGAEVRAWQAILREMLARHRSLSTTDVANIERERAVVRLYGEALDRAHRVLADLSRLNLEERRTRVTELQGALILAALERTLTTIGLDAPQMVRARTLLAAELTDGNRGA